MVAGEDGGKGGQKGGLEGGKDWEVEGSLKVRVPWGGVWGNPCPRLLRNVIVRYPDGQILETILMSGRVCEVSAAPQTFLFSSEADSGFEIRHPALQKLISTQPGEII